MTKILVIGDSCIDQFVYGQCDRLCPEGPIPVFTPNYIKTNPGMANYVGNNLIQGFNIGCEIIAATSPSIKTRYIDERSNQLLLRVDQNDKLDNIDKYLEQIDFTKYDAVIISDYDKGFLTTEDILYISKQHDLTFLDTKKRIDSWAYNITFLKINYLEYLNSKDFIDKHYYSKTIITKGRDGAYFKGQEYKIENKSTILDVSGAGDIFLAALVYEYLKAKNIDNAITYANKCASYAVTQKGMTPIIDYLNVIK